MHYFVLVADDGRLDEILDRFMAYPNDTRDKPEGRWDWYRAGGRFEGRLHLRQPRTGLSGQTTRVSVAKKLEIDLDSLLDDPPFALLFRRELREAPIRETPETAARWNGEFRRLLTEIPDEATLRVVDAHG